MNIKKYWIATFCVCAALGLSNEMWGTQQQIDSAIRTVRRYEETGQLPSLEAIKSMRDTVTQVLNSKEINSITEIKLEYLKTAFEEIIDGVLDFSQIKESFRELPNILNNLENRYATKENENLQDQIKCYENKIASLKRELQRSKNFASR